MDKEELQRAIDTVAAGANALMALGAGREVWEHIFIGIENCMEWAEDEYGIVLE